MAASYCGITLALDTPEHAAFVGSVHDFRVDRITQNDGWAGVDTEYLQLTWLNPQDALPEIGVLTWPIGAARCATFYMLVGGEQLDLIRTAVEENAGVGDLILSDGNSGHTITAENMRLLPPLPVHKIGSLDEDQKLYLLILVDQRYDWRERALSVVPGEWAAFFDDVSDAIGQTIEYDTFPEAYQSMSVRWTQYLKPVPALLDAAAASIQRRVVVQLDGSVTLEKWEDAVTDSEDQFEDVKKIIGGQLEVDDLTRIVPAIVRVAFGQVLAGVIQDSPYVVPFSLEELAVPGFGDEVGVLANTKILNADYIYDGTNSTECEDFAEQLAYDWYGWHLCSVYFTAPGILNWFPTGAEDYIEWRYQYEGKLLTRVVRGPFQVQERGGWNPAIPYRDPLVRVISTGGGSGEYSNRYTVRQVYITGSYDLEDVTAPSFIEWEDVVEIMNRQVPASASPVPEYGVYPLHIAPDGHYYIDADEALPVFDGGGSGSGNDNPCGNCFPDSGQGDSQDEFTTVEVFCIDGILWVVYARQGIIYDASTGRIRIELYDYTWDTAGCCDCTDYGDGSGSGLGSGNGCTAPGCDTYTVASLNLIRNTLSSDCTTSTWEDINNTYTLQYSLIAPGVHAWLLIENSSGCRWIGPEDWDGTGSETFTRHPGQEYEGCAETQTVTCYAEASIVTGCCGEIPSTLYLTFTTSTDCCPEQGATIPLSYDVTNDWWEAINYEGGNCTGFPNRFVLYCCDFERDVANDQTCAAAGGTGGEVVTDWRLYWECDNNPDQSVTASPEGGSTCESFELTFSPQAPVGSGCCSADTGVLTITITDTAP
jgi:hypothetical protein